MFPAMLPEYQLIQAIKSGCLADFNEAVSRGATVGAKDFDRRSVLEVAMQRGRTDLARRLIRNGADPNGAIGKRGDRLIHRAAQTGNIGFLIVLLESGVDANSSGVRRRTPLHMVTKGGYEFMAVGLLGAGGNPDSTDNQGNTPLHIAAETGQFPLVRLFLKYNANATRTNNQLYTPIHNAAANGHTDATKLMLDHVQATDPNFRASELPERIRQVAERHSQHETANAISESWPAIACKVPF